MKIHSSQCLCRAATVASALLDAWLAGDGVSMRRQLSDLAAMSPTARGDDECERVELLRGIASQLELEATPPSSSASSRTTVLLNLLRHLSAGLLVTH